VGPFNRRHDEGDLLYSLWQFLDSIKLEEPLLELHSHLEVVHEDPFYKFPFDPEGLALDR
jgi:hypothetical protein